MNVLIFIVVLFLLLYGSGCVLVGMIYGWVHGLCDEGFYGSEIGGLFMCVYCYVTAYLCMRVCCLSYDLSSVLYK